MVSFNYKLFRTNRLGSYTYSQDLRQLCLCWPPIIKTTNVKVKCLKLSLILTIAKSGASVGVGVWNVCFQLVSPLFLLCGVAAVLAPPHPGGSSVQVPSVGDPGAWSLDPGCYPGHINLPSIYSVPPPARAMAVTQGESWYPIHNFMTMGLCVICNLYKILVII